MPWSIDDIPDQSYPTAVITGANGGLGLASATALAGAGAHVVMAARNQTKAAAARDEILSTHPAASLEIVEVDLGSLASVEKASEQIIERHDRIGIFMCNAGVMAMPPETTDDGFDVQMGINVLGHLKTPAWADHMMALLTGGEAFHDHHHDHPISALHRPRKGVWNRIVDYNGTMLLFYVKLGWVKNLKIAPQFA